jgi:hypothetical protein
MRMRGLALALLVALTGCGPIEYLGQVTRRASRSVEAARAVGAERLAPYEYTSAVEYLHKAREEAAEAQYESAVRLGRKSEEMAESAYQLALKRVKAGEP